MFWRQPQIPAPVDVRLPDPDGHVPAVISRLAAGLDATETGRTASVATFDDVTGLEVHSQTVGGGHDNLAAARKCPSRLCCRPADRMLKLTAASCDGRRMATVPQHHELPRPNWSWLPIALIWAGFLAMVLLMEHRWPVQVAIVTVGVAVEALAGRSRRTRIRLR